ncbi:hypothetical protein BD410DRAFT_726943 [Rickenella mellea]|uniref:Uncharacterized protein n=1 Tax=Rickenella mellea TaxID=50990 RepID=A0A4Y7PX05_9AGAM|nr:hypothetical protein BD410DRAFT_726943 [Rickenella mellea]
MRITFPLGDFAPAHKRPLDFRRLLIYPQEPNDDNEDGEDDRGVLLVTLVTSAVRGGKPNYSLAEVSRAIARSGCASDIDALHVVPLLVKCPDEAATEILALLGECGNAKEVVIAVQEAMEHLREELSAVEFDSDNDEAELESSTRSTSYKQLGKLLDLYSSAIPRLKLRQKTAAETLRPLLSDIQGIIELAGPLFNNTDGRVILEKVARLVERCAKWANDQPPKEGVKVEEIGSSSGAKSLLLTTLGSLANCIGADIAQREFESSNPRLFPQARSSVRSDAHVGDAIMSVVKDAFSVLHLSNDELLMDRSIGSLVLLGHTNTNAPIPIPPNTLLSYLLPVIISSIQNKLALDESLYILLTSAASLKTSKAHLDADLATPLCSVLAPLASMHPEPSTRLLTFHILGSILSVAPPVQRMELFHDLLTEEGCPFPQMHVAAVGLLKDAVLEALAEDRSPDGGSSKKTGNPFASPNLLRTFGPVVFRPSPPDLFASPPDLKAFLDTQEPRRLVECLSFYFILLSRDTRNLTGISDADCIKSVEKSLIGPLRATLQYWMSSGQDAHDMSLAALELAIERVDSKLASM